MSDAGEVVSESTFSMLNEQRGVKVLLLPIDRRAYGLNIVCIAVMQIGRFEQRAEWQEVWEGIVIRSRWTVAPNLQAQKWTILRSSTP